jgi:leukotriene-A4 hydrolase
MPFDPTSQSNLDEVKTNHIHLTLAVEFAAKTLVGTVDLEVQAIADNVAKVVLDTSFIDVRSVTAANQKLKVI